MCGRARLSSDVSEIKIIFNIDEKNDRSGGDEGEDWNVAPSRRLPVVIFEKGQRVLERMVWGLIPSWAKDAKMGFSTFNARADSIDTKPAFRGAWKAGRRCLVVTDGFYEWRKADKQPFAVAMKNIKLMVMAGLWEEWKNPEDGETAPDHDAMHRALPSR